jgi:curved DNA-binding protein CbpA
MNMGEKTNHYKTLGIAPDADKREIRSAYRTLAKRYHPDAGKGSSAERFRAVQTAYELLNDADKRKNYDMGRTAGPQIPVKRASPYSSRAAHIDLRNITDLRARVYAESIGSEYSWKFEPDDRDPWEDLFDLLFRGF